MKRIYSIETESPDVVFATFDSVDELKIFLKKWLADKELDPEDCGWIITAREIAPDYDTFIKDSRRYSGTDVIEIVDMLGQGD